MNLKKAVNKMSGFHLMAAIPLLLLLIISMIWYGRGLLHLMLIGYSGVLAFIAAGQQWELLFFPLIAGTLVIGLILFTYSMTKGDWL